MALCAVCATDSVAQTKKPLRLLNADMDLTHGIVRSDKAQQGISLPQAFNGEGVLLTVADIGFDFTHPNFGDSRIVRFWDMLSRDTIGQEHLFTGHEYTDEGEIRALKHSYDGESETHATHVLGIAAGTGAKDVYGTDKYRGIAPEADLVLIGNVLSNNAALVDSLQWSKYNGYHEFEVFKYAFDYAESVGKPCVINMSCGQRQTFYDNFPIYNRMIDELTGPGRIIVASAGNQGKQKVHLHKPQGKQTVQSRFYPPFSGGAFFLQKNGDCKLELFYRNNEDEELKPIPETCYAVLDTVSDFDSTPVKCIVLRDSLPQKLGFMYSHLSGSEDSEAHLFTYGVVFMDDEGWSDADNNYSVNFPSCYDNVISVGYMNYRDRIMNARGEEKYWPQGELTKANENSSVGPRLDGYQKPDIMAPGTIVISSYNSFYEEANPEASDVVNSTVEYFMNDGRKYAWTVNSGSSMSAPVVTGIIALWLEANPRLTPQDIKDIFKRTARHPDPTLSYPNAIYGYGEIDAYAGLLDILGISNIEGISHHQPQAVRFAVKGNSVEAYAKDSNELLQINIYTTNGAKVKTPRLTPGVYVVEVVTDKPELKGSTLVRIR
ncbi:MAG: S8 family serine peptidase [Bacteroidaceae bacterium]|nr:S8 family serine peptidase [Bacteroidaceae bacterium]